MIKKIFLILIILLISFMSMVRATTFEGILQGSDNWLQSGKEQSGTGINQSKLDEMSGLIYNILLTIGICAAVIVGAIMGIQFITGSVEQKGKIKEALIPFVVGCVVIFGAFGIWKLVITILR